MYVKPITLSLALAGLLLAGCSSTDKPAAPAAAAPAAMQESASATAPSFGGTCDSAAVAALVGKTANLALVDQAKRQSGAETARVLRPHDAVTMDYNSRRLNIDVDETDVVKQFTCG
ncbi:I78 family peptidase inhibitor [Pseudomonas sp. TCU-HL1]|uniref:I78 family peptidase inhibitor n=1 Tax=Pseudomonas sp. TCU-HL1 TaxID=1856685 RepID=UPI00083D139C|nr:I78 family peptidase inhibitor [Pseudomonas sp. TCU-HL1]AOE84981.1 lipoprotein [Pseudomonas sp. TCU-HL1]